MNIAVIHGGEKVRQIWDAHRKYPYPENRPRIVAVVEEDEASDWAHQARECGLFVTSDPGELLARGDLDVIVDLRDDRHGVHGRPQPGRTGPCRLSAGNGLMFLDMLLGVVSSEKMKRELEDLKIRHSASINAFLQEDVLLIGRDYEILDVNEAMLQKLGLAREEVVGKHCYEVSHGRVDACDGREHPCPLKQCLETGAHAKTTHVHRDKKGREIYFSISCYPVIDKGGIVGAVEISKDITKDIRMEKNLYQREKMASIGQLAAGVAHEINNPLTTILTTAMLIQEDMGEEEPNYQELRTVVEEALRCRKIVKSLLDYARQSKPRKTPEDLNGIVRETIALTRKQAAFKDVQFETSLSESPPVAYLDKDQIEQSLINLVLNAIEASNPGGIIRVTTRRLPEKSSIEVSVHDTGKGISDADLDMIFDPFFTTTESGTGLGLAITHGIVQRHGGSIEVESKEGRGTTFRIRLPVAPGVEDGP